MTTTAHADRYICTHTYVIDASQIRAITTNCVTSESKKSNRNFQLFGCTAFNQTCFHFIIFISCALLRKLKLLPSFEVKLCCQLTVGSEYHSELEFNSSREKSEKVKFKHEIAWNYSRFVGINRRPLCQRSSAREWTIAILHRFESTK